MSFVTVLTPNGRRQNVKITPNTTLLQVLEEVCSKHGFKPEDYDIRHHNKILDVSAIFRFSGLPNNAQLEMTEITKQRSESPVVLGLHLESGDRLTGEFSPSDNLWNVISTLNPEEAKTFTSPVVIYMRKEVCGKENLEKTTLRSLGLTGGRAILRFFNKTPEELSVQANVSANLSHSITSYNQKDNNRKFENEAKENKPAVSKPSPEKSQLKEIKKGDIQKEDRKMFQVLPEKKQDSKLVEPERKNNSSKVTKVEKEDVAVDKDTVTASKVAQSNVNQTPESSKSNKCSYSEKFIHTDEDEKNKVILLGERDAVAYNLNKIKPVVFEEVPDDFYDLTVSDAKLLLKDAKRICAELQDAPLMTSAQRELEKNKKILSLLNQYKRTVLRIKFPDRTVLQGTFSSVEKVSAVEKFVADYLEFPETSFYLYMTPPKEILNSENNLLEANCVPCAVLYFGVRSGGKEVKQFLRSDVLEKFSSPSAAALTAYQSRGLATDRKKWTRERKNSDDKQEEVIEKMESVQGPGPSTSDTSSRSKQSRVQQSPPFKVPKWFKIQK